jgi:uncharacterized protein
MLFEWDKAKAEGNARKHGVCFADTFAVFEDPNALTVDDHEQGEERLVTIGMDCLGRLLVMVYTWRGDSIRIISARRANRHEGAQDEGEL